MRVAAFMTMTDNVFGVVVVGGVVVGQGRQVSESKSRRKDKQVP